MTKYKWIHILPCTQIFFLFFNSEHTLYLRCFVFSCCGAFFVGAACVCVLLFDCSWNEWDREERNARFVTLFSLYVEFCSHFHSVHALLALSLSIYLFHFTVLLLLLKCFHRTLTIFQCVLSPCLSLPLSHSHTHTWILYMCVCVYGSFWLVLTRDFYCGK